MKLYYYEGEGSVRNFGDELNPYLWGRLLPDLERRGSDGLDLRRDRDTAERAAPHGEPDDRLRLGCGVRQDRAQA